MAETIIAVGGAPPVVRIAWVSHPQCRCNASYAGWQPIGRWDRAGTVLLAAVDREGRFSNELGYFDAATGGFRDFNGKPLPFEPTHYAGVRVPPVPPPPEPPKDAP